MREVRRDPRLPVSGVVQKASYLRPKNLPRLLSMPSAAARGPAEQYSRAPGFRAALAGGAGGGGAGRPRGARTPFRAWARAAGCREQAGRKGRSRVGWAGP